MGFTNIRIAATCAALCAANAIAESSAPSSAATQATQASGDAVAELRSQLPDFDREDMHPGDPLRIVGVNEGENELLKNTHALKRSEYRPVQVDLNDEHARQLALFEGETFDRPGRARAMSTRERRRAHKRAQVLRAPGLTEDPDAEEEGSTNWLGLLMTAAGATALLVTRGRLTD